MNLTQCPSSRLRAHCQKKKSVSGWMKKKSNTLNDRSWQTLNDTVITLTDGRVSLLLSTLNLEKPIYRARIENAKVDHFLDYISRPELLQDVAFGTKTLKLDSGGRVIIPAVVRTLIPSRVIQQYICNCKQEQFQPALERSLYRILDVCSASMQKSLQGLDNVTAEGTEAIDNLTKMIETSWKRRGRRMG